MPQRGLLKICSVLLCFFITTLLLLQISAVNAYPTRRALIWGSESAGAIDEDVPGDFDHWRKTETEVERQQIVCNALANYFGDDHYDVDDYQGDDSTRSMILANISDAETNY